jgi:hypothetical protein
VAGGLVVFDDLGLALAEGMAVADCCFEYRWGGICEGDSFKLQIILRKLNRTYFYLLAIPAYLELLAQQLKVVINQVGLWTPASHVTQ